jgi:PTH1 family peptidyl-tRNA hydrolase
MNIIIGLGNPGKDYVGTRHNVGFEVIDKLAYDYNISVNKSKHKALMAEGTIKDKKVVLLKPQTYMNLSGESVKEALSWYKCSNKDIIVIYDDISLDVGEIRVRQQGSAGGHNGMKSIIQQLGTDEFIRVRIGIGEKPKNWDLADYVLGRFAKEEIEPIIEGFKKAADACEMVLDTGVLSAMNKYNQKKRGE